MVDDINFLLIGNSRLHWAENLQNKYRFFHTQKNNKIPQNNNNTFSAPLVVLSSIVFLLSLLLIYPEVSPKFLPAGYFIEILKEIDSLNLTEIPNRKILVLLAQQEQITDNKAVTQLIERFEFIDVVTIKEAQHEILIEKEKIRHEALSLMNTFLKS